MKRKNKLNKRGNRKLMLVGVGLIVLIGFIFIVSALTPEEELSQLENDLVDSGYEWLINYSVEYPSVEVYVEGGDEMIADFGEINSDGKYRILLDGSSGAGLGGVEKISRDILIKKMRLDEINREFKWKKRLNLKGDVNL